MFKCGYVGVIGKTNSGKSSLVNFLVGEKVSIVTPKTQTTQQNITGILTKPNFQIVFIDTPGIHKSINNLDRVMMKNVRSAIGTVDVLLYIIDASKKIDTHDLENIKKYGLEENIPIIIGLSKIDLISKNKLIEVLTQFSEFNFVQDIIPYSIKSGVNTENILESILKILPKYKEKTLIYDEDLYTDNSVRFLTSEIIREKAMLNLEDELPHGVKIIINKFEEKPTITTIEADLICERESHKAIIVGKNGEKIKEIGTLARQDIEKLLDCKVLLKIFVKVDKNWRQNKNPMV